ncbi:uncharacterized protein BDW43DRAFT_292809 [Aspergillus alliaceus]|uniref:uncharacterized protein n=1 Tax=Petromyces alliaceus TaxID=209559 RepID=UPI0012A3FB9D|nr:uncharacterized protein BDW43DRAFT_292809 [Aspergillus alliaceus]KAB8227916.1 hypothetical protein BDW43DRAFT_292809 [Aspergillus alliaceus]
MSNNEADSRRAVNERIADAGSNTISAIVDAGRSSQKKRAENRARREAQESGKEAKSSQSASGADTSKSA